MQIQESGVCTKKQPEILAALVYGFQFDIHSFFYMVNFPFVHQQISLTPLQTHQSFQGNFSFFVPCSRCLRPNILLVFGNSGVFIH